MKKLGLTITLITLLTSLAIGQQIHTPAEIFKLMEKSPVSYELKELKQPVPVPDRSANLNFNDFYRVQSGNEIFTYRYSVNDTVSSYLKKAEDFFQSRQYSFARDMYMMALKLDSTYYQSITYIGQTYEIEGNLDEAITWYQKAIDKNYIDYMAHWFMADAYKVKGELKTAVDEITIAQILNRNNPRILRSLNEIYQLNKLKTKEWVFNPQMEIDSTGPHNVSIASSPDWLGYAMVKALWAYEPGYRESMGVKKNTYSTLEEKECFALLINGFSKKKLRKHPEYKALNLALDKYMINEYIFYEIILPDNPFAAYQLSEEFINSIKDYVIQIRGSKI